MTTQLEYTINPIADVRAGEDDIVGLAKIYRTLYDDAEINEFWTEEQAAALLHDYQKKYPEIFLVAHIGEQAVGAVMSRVKPWFDGNHLFDLEIFVGKEWQRRGIANELLRRHLILGKQIFGAVALDAETYDNGAGHPVGWYERIGFERKGQIIPIAGDIDMVLGTMLQ